MKKPLLWAHISGYLLMGLMSIASAKSRTQRQVSAKTQAFKNRVHRQAQSLKNRTHRQLSTKAKSLVRTAKQHLGEAYIYGDVGYWGYDCSGFVQTVFRKYGLKLPRNSRQQYRVGRPVAPQDLRMGDLLFFSSQPGSERVSHVAIVIGQGKMIHAARHMKRVVISKIDHPYYMKRLVAARRIEKLWHGTR
jgi:cell wall-associated NlpC family hydrolase